MLIGLDMYACSTRTKGIHVYHTHTPILSLACTLSLVLFLALSHSYSFSHTPHLHIHEHKYTYKCAPSKAFWHAASRIEAAMQIQIQLYIGLHIYTLSHQ